MAKALLCPHCGGELLLALPLSRRADCPGCRQELHTCHSCKLHDSSAHNQCREPKAEWQSQRQRGNYCDFFELAAPGPDEPPADTKEAQRQQQLDDLFKNF